MNILVGENEAGKSTILEAIKVVLNQQYRNLDKSILQDLFNSDMVAQFKRTPSLKTLPQIRIELELELDSHHKNAAYFYGELYGKRKSQNEQYGITFECKYDNELGAGMEQSILDGEIPYEYYVLKWTTFANRPYQIIKRPLNFLTIDVTNSLNSASFNYYNKTLFMSKYDETIRTKAKNNFRVNLKKAFESTNLLPLSENRKFGIDSKKIILESILSVYENGVALENHGSGMESLIKTQIALDKANSLDVILIEEPENHLSFSNLQKMLSEISSQKNDSQIIVTTHSNMIASRLNLKNVLWITVDGVKSLGNVNDDVAEFFVRADNNGFLQLLLSPKVFLVEGATEFLLLPKFYKQITGKSIEEDGVTVISCNGISYKKYLEVIKDTNKKVAVITDNDQDKKKIDAAQNFNQQNLRQHIYMDENIDNWTWEICIYNSNKEILNSMITVEKGAKYLFHGANYGSVVGKMLNNKVDVAYQMLISENKFEVPEYVKDAIIWLNK